MTPELQAIAAKVAASQSTLVVVDAIDLAAAEAALSFARSCSAIVAHAEPDDIEVLQNQGYFTTSPSEAALRGDVVLVVGALSDNAISDEGFNRILNKPDLKAVVHLDTGDSPAIKTPIAKPERIAVSADELPDVLGTVTAMMADRPVNGETAIAAKAAHLRETLENATYGIMAHETGRLPRYSLFAAMALADELSKTTRWSLLPVGRASGQSELIRMTQATSGLPPPLQFNACRGHHDSATLDPQALTEDGDVQTLVWISASTSPRPAWLRKAPTLIAIDANPKADADHHITTGVAGVDYTALLDPSELSAFIALKPSGETRDDLALAPLLATLTEHVLEQLPKPVLNAAAQVEAVSS
ncbi:MAG: hypothetical protein AAFO75_02140 [Pseudomonadota bacterium]